MKVGARLALSRHAVDRADSRAIDKDDPLVARAHSGEIGLHHHRFPRGGEEHFQKRIQILVRRGQTEDPGPAIAEQRFDDDVLVRLAEALDGFRIARDQGRRHQVGKHRHEKFFRRIPYFGRVVHHHCRRGQHLQEMRCGDIGHVEGRVLPHQDDVKIGKPAFFGRTGAGMISDNITKGEALANRLDGALVQRQPVRRVIPEAVSARLRLQHQPEARVTGDVDGSDRIHLDGNLQRHGGGLLPLVGAKCDVVHHLLRKAKLARMADNAVHLLGISGHA